MGFKRPWTKPGRRSTGEGCRSFRGARTGSPACWVSRSTPAWCRLSSWTSSAVGWSPVTGSRCSGGGSSTAGTGTVYDDSAADDGPFVPHMVSEVVKVHETLLGIPLSSIQVEAHPKIKSNPFIGAYEFRLVVKPPAPSPVAQHGPL